MSFSGITAVFSVSLVLGLYLVYRKITSMSKPGSPLFKIGYFFYSRTSIGYYYYRKEVTKAQNKYNKQPHTFTQPTVFDGLSILPIALSLDNYCYLVVDQRTQTSILIDPADPEPVQEVLTKQNLTLTAILTTHRHWDHSAGNKQLHKQYKNIPVYGSRLDNVPGTTHPLSDGDRINFGDLVFSVVHTPGHTSGHIVFVLQGEPYGAPDSIFSGDHLFLGGIGRMFEELPATMLVSLDKVCSLPNSTLVWPGHEYAENNLEFALHIDPDNTTLQEKYAWVKEQRKDRLCTCPSTIGEEKQYNPFLRTTDVNILTALGLADEADNEARRAKALQLCRTRKDDYKYSL